MSDRVRAQPCEACPYRRDVPSGVWTTDEYDKLVEYDKPTGDQPFAAFQCHATPDFYCHGWAVVHSNRGKPFELLALRFATLRGISVCAIAAQATHCVNGHEFTAANTKIRPDGNRKCRECHNQRKREYRAKQKVLA